MKVICFDNTGAPELIEGDVYTVINKDKDSYKLKEQHIDPMSGNTNTWYFKWRFLPCSEIEEGILEFETVQL